MFTVSNNSDQGGMSMAVARVVTFDGVTSERMAQMRAEMGDQGRPDQNPV